MVEEVRVEAQVENGQRGVCLADTTQSKRENEEWGNGSQDKLHKPDNIESKKDGVESSSKQKGLLKQSSEILPDWSDKKEKVTSSRVTVTCLGGNSLNQSAELAYTYKVPERYEDLVELLKGRSPAEVGLIIERMVKCNHVSLAEHNRAKLLSLYSYLMQYINDAPLEDIWNTIEQLKLQLFELMHFSPKESADFLKDIINKKYEAFMKRKHKHPRYESYYFIRLVEILYPTSDKFHSVSSMALLYMSQVLSQAQLTSRRAIASALFLATQMANYVRESKRVSTEAVSRLAEILELATPNPIEPSPQKAARLKLLYLQQAHTSLGGESLKMHQSDLDRNCGKVDDDFRVRCVHIAVCLVGTFIPLYEDIPGATLYFDPFRSLINRIELDKYPCETGELFERVRGQLVQLAEKEVTCQPPAPKLKTKLLRLFEPRIQPVYEGKRRRDGGVEGRAELDKLVHKVRSERKGALREIRRDNAFIAKLKFTQQAANDADRVRRVNQIYGWAAQQQGDINKIKRSKK